MATRDVVLTQILAETDALWLPNREWTGRRPANVYIGRRDFGRFGVPWASREHSEAGWKESQRALAALSQAGLVKATRLRRVKTSGVRLSDEADAAARVRCGLPGVDAGWAALVKLAGLSRRPAKVMGDAWIPETALADASKPPREELSLVEDMLLPAMVRGWVVSLSDVQRHVCYRTTLAGWQMVDAGEPPTVPAGCKVSRELAALYDDRLQAALARLEASAPVDTREIGDVPLPVHMAGVELPAVWAA
jgi:hypothetical protein